MSRKWIAGFYCALALSLGTVAVADEGGISVIGVGEVKARPNKVEFGVRVTGTGELSNDAIVKFTESRRRTLSAFEKLKIPGLKFEELGTSLNSSTAGPGEEAQFNMPMMRSGTATPAKRTTTISRGIKLTVTGIDKLKDDEVMSTVAKVLDAIKDSGANLSSEGAGDMRSMMMMEMFGRSGMSRSPITFVLDESVDLKKQATQKAFADAKAQAHRLAELAGAELGDVLSVNEGASSGSDQKDNNPMSSMFGIYAAMMQGSDSKSGSNEFGEVAVRSSLQVRFAIKSKGK